MVGGVTPACRHLAATLYRQIIDRVVPVSSTQVAEMVKLFENTFRSVNIALVNELAIMCRRLGLSVWEVIDAAADQALRLHAVLPGAGHRRPLPAERPALPLLAGARSPATRPSFIAFADEINGGMPRYVVQLAADALNDRAKAVKGSRILALGVAYKAGVGDVRDSPALEIIEDLLARGAQRRLRRSAGAADPGGRPRSSRAWPGRRPISPSYDLVVLLTAHPEFEPARLVRDARLVLDTRNATGALGDLRHVIRI